MTFRSKLFWIFTLALVVSVGAISFTVARVTQRAFDQMTAQNTDALMAQFRQEYARSGQDVVNRVRAIAEEQGTIRMAVALSLPPGDASIYVNDAKGVSQSHQLDFLDFVGSDGTIISSNEWPARYGYKMDWVTQQQDWVAAGSFLMKVDTQDGPALGLMAVSRVPVADQAIYIIGGARLGKDFLASLALPAGMRSLLYMNLDPAFQAANLVDASGAVEQPERLAPLIGAEMQQPAERSEVVAWSQNPANAEVFHELPLVGRQGELLGVLLVGSSRREAVMFEQRIEWLALGVVGAGLILGLLVSWWGTARVTSPLQDLAEGAREVAKGNWGAHVEARGGREVKDLAAAFNQMTHEITEQRERLVQAERVAAWRELARRLAHELKNPLFPLQTTVENLERAKEQSPEQFDEVFHESTGILLAEIRNLKQIVGRFSDFSKMPRPELGPVNVNEVIRGAVKLFEAQLSAVGRPPIHPELHLEENLPTIQADAMLLNRAIENLILNSMDAMPSGGVLMIRTTHDADWVNVEISDTGSGLTKEECDRLFTPYYTTKQHGTGLGLAIVQLVVSDHGGTIAVESESGVGTSFVIRLPIREAKVMAPDAKAPGTVATSTTATPVNSPVAPAPAQPPVEARTETSATSEALASETSAPEGATVEAEAQASEHGEEHVDADAPQMAGPHEG